MAYDKLVILQQKYGESNISKKYRKIGLVIFLEINILFLRKRVKIIRFWRSRGTLF